MFRICNQEVVQIKSLAFLDETALKEKKNKSATTTKEKKWLGPHHYFLVSTKEDKWEPDP